MNRIGYCCISVGINAGKRKKDHVLVNRGMIKKTFETKGLSYVSELTLLNLNDLKKILKYNLENKIYVYRMSSDMFPCIGFYKLEELPRFELIKNTLKDIGDYVIKNNMRVSFHPSHFCVLASENPEVVKKTVDELDKHAEIMDMMGLEKSHYYPINIHVGITKPSCEEAMKRFCQNFTLLSDSCKARLTVENDDSPNQFSVKMLYDGIYEKIGVPIVVDSFHYRCYNAGLDWETTLKIATSTWKVKPLCHHSSSKKEHEDSSSKLEAHADFLYEEFKGCGEELDIELECKQKDLALKKYRTDYIKE